MKSKLLIYVSVLVAIAMLVSCAPAQVTPEIVKETVVVQQPGEIVVETQIVEVPKEVVKEVTPTAPAKSFEGVELNILTFTGPQIAEPLQRRGPDFTALTGAKVNVIIVPFNELYQKMLTDMATGTNSFDGFVFAPQWMADFVTPGYLEDLTDRVAADKDVQWDDIAPFFRDFSATFNGRIYLIPLDGDFHMIYYRTDLLAENGFNPPETWDDYLKIAQFFNGKDLNGDGKPDYGSCISKQRGAQGWQFLWSFIAPYLQTQGTSQGAFFDTKTFDPLVKNDGWKKGVEIFKETGKYGPPEELNMDVGATRGLFVTGRCALSIDWGDIGTLAIDPASSTVIDKVGAVMTPGTKEVADFANGKLVPCDEKTCPYAVNGVNHAPYACFGGWSAGINAAVDAMKKDAAYAFFSYMAQPAQANVDVTIGKTGFNPYRMSQFLNREAWVAAGMSAKAASDYLGAIEGSLANPNMVLDLRIPQNQRYLQVEMDALLAQYLAGEITIDQFQSQLFDKWQAVTDELERDTQLEAYLASLGVQK